MRNGGTSHHIFGLLLCTASAGRATATAVTATTTAPAATGQPQQNHHHLATMPTGRGPSPKSERRIARTATHKIRTVRARQKITQASEEEPRMNTNECKQSISGLVTVVGATGLARQHKCLEGTIYIYGLPPPCGPLVGAL